MRARRWATVAACLLAACGQAVWAATGPSLQSAAASPPVIPFKAEPEGILTLVLPALILVLLIAVGMWAAVRFVRKRGFQLPMIRSAPRRLGFVETLYVTSKLRVHLIEIDGGPVLVSESGGHVSMAFPPKAPDHKGN
jgi:flagellar biogenesis protein FliO